MTRPDIREPGDIDAAWLTAVLAEGGVEAEVRSFTARQVGTGQIGDSVRFTLDYARRGEGAPDSLVVRQPVSPGRTGFMTLPVACVLPGQSTDLTPNCLIAFDQRSTSVARKLPNASGDAGFSS